MLKEIENEFAGVLDIQGDGNRNSVFSVNDRVVTVTAVEDTDKEFFINKLLYNNVFKNKNHWFYGFAEGQYSIAFLKNGSMSGKHFVPTRECVVGRFFAPLIIKSSIWTGVIIDKFNKMEFVGGVVDIVNYGDSTNIYKIQCNNEEFDLTYLKENDHFVLRFSFNEYKEFDDFEKYYNYAIELLRFCTGRMNVRSDINLYYDDILMNTKIHDGLNNYVDELPKPIGAIYFKDLGDNLPKLFKLLNEEKTMPNLYFLPNDNEKASSIYYFNIADICSSFEIEYECNKIKVDKEIKASAKKLSDKLSKVVDEFECQEEVKEKAKNIINYDLKKFSPTLKEKIDYFYDIYKNEMKKITEDIFRKKTIYTDEEFKRLADELRKMRNKISHSNIKWNEGTNIYEHLKVLIYINILVRAGCKQSDTPLILNNLFYGKF